MKIIIAAFAGGLALTGILSPAPAQAQAVRTFVSPTGNDGANCSLATPCRTFAAAYALTNAGGEIGVLGTAGYGTLTISKPISIVNGGGFEAGIAVPLNGTGITINAGTNDAVSLRGLSIEGGGVGLNGIQFNTGASLTVENCVIRHLQKDGIFFTPNATSSLTVSNSLMADNINDGIEVLPSGSGTVKAVFNHVQATNNFNGILVNGANSTGTVNSAVYDSVASGGNSFGFAAFSSAGHAPTTLMLFHSVAANNTVGIELQGSGATLRLAHSMVTGNTFGWNITGGVLLSDGDNTIEGNASSETALTTYARK